MSRYLTISHMCYVEVHVEEHVKEHGEDSDRFKVMGTTGAAGLQRPPRLKAGRGTSPFFDHIIDKHKPMRDFQYRMLALVSQKYFRISKRILTLAGSQELFWLAAGHRNWREGGRGGERGRGGRQQWPPSGCSASGRTGGASHHDINGHSAAVQLTFAVILLS